MIYLLLILLRILNCTVNYDLIITDDKKYTSHSEENTSIHFQTDFNYNEISLMDKKMPFINCNRNIMVGQRTDLVDIFIHGNTDFLIYFS